ncbi:type II secretion system F family protein [soil metagenome]
MVRVTQLGALAVLCGLGLGLGLWTLAGAIPRLGRPRLAERVAPYLVDVSPGARELVSRRSIEPLPIVGALFGPLFSAFRSAIDRAMGGPATIELRLRQAGSALGVAAFRSQQVLWGLGGALVGAVLSAALSWVADVPLPILPVLVAVLLVGGIVARDYLLQRSARARVSRISSELPTVLEFLTLSLSAGEGIIDALRRVATASNGELAREFGHVVAAVTTGTPLAEALRELGNAIRLPALDRVIDQVTAALERGTPLAEVLGAQAQDAREAAKRDLLELAGKKEVAMLLPLVFLILPITIAFAIFPGIAVLQLGF